MSTEFQRHPQTIDPVAGGLEGPQAGTERMMGFEHKGCAYCGCQHHEAKSILYRINADPSFAELWRRLDAAERDRNRMLNALQHIRDHRLRDKIQMPPRLWNIINRALSKVEPSMKDPQS